MCSTGNDTWNLQQLYCDAAQQRGKNLSPGEMAALSILVLYFRKGTVISTLQYHFLSLPSNQKPGISREAQPEWWWLKFLQPVSVKL